MITQAEMALNPEYSDLSAEGKSRFI